MSFLLGIDQGTSGSRAVVLDDEGQVHGYAYRPLTRLYPHPDRVEQDPDVVASGVAEVIAAALDAAGCRPADLVAAGLTSQRNTDFVWDARNGRPLANAITWQDLRTLPLLAELRQWPLAAEARQRLGYAPGPYMSALHLAWRMRHDPAVIATAREGCLRLGLSAAWLLVALGRPSGHQMDRSLVQATGLYDIRQDSYWAEWLDWLGVPPSALPTAGPTIQEYGTINVADLAGRTAAIPVLAMIGDQQAALFGQGCRTPGAVECTLGTAAYVKLFLGQQAPPLEAIDVLCAWDTGQGQTYCLEAATTVAGAALRWMQEDLRLFDSYQEADQLAASVGYNAVDRDAPSGVIFVPALSGLNAPYNDPNVRGTILGLTLGTGRAHIIRAFMEALGHQIRTILDVIRRDTAVEVKELLVGGGVSASDIACQIQADLIGLPVVRPTFTETTAHAAALLAGLGAGVWPDVASLPPLPGGRTTFDPQLNATQRDNAYERWQQAIDLVRNKL